jgi:hypothetical protein
MLGILGFYEGTFVDFGVSYIGHDEKNAKKGKTREKGSSLAR